MKRITIILTLALLLSCSGCINQCAISSGDVSQNVTYDAGWAVWVIGAIMLILALAIFGAMFGGGGRHDGPTGR